MELILDPPSGLADSYFDVEFTVSFADVCDKATIRLFNEINHEQLDILGVSSGYVQNDSEAIAKNVSEISGHINLFNNDKMNKMFKAYSHIVIRCEAEITRNDETYKENESIEFYNESKSLDASVIPIDLSIQNPKLDIDNNEALHIDIVTSMQKKIELCIRSDDTSSECCIQVSCRSGMTSVYIPAEFMYYDLNLKENYRKKYKFYYIKYQGTNFSRLGSRQYMSINDTELEFILPEDITAQPQSRINPTGKVYTDDFILSDRYLVLCPRQYSGFSGKGDVGSRKALDIVMLLHESQHMRSLSRQIQQFAEEDETKKKMRETAQAIQDEKFRQARPPAPHINPEQMKLLSSVAGVYDQVSSSYKRSMHKQPQATASTFSQNAFPNKREKKSGCAPCARKRLKNA